MRESRFTALGIAAATVAILVLLPFMIVFGFYAFANVQAILTGTELSSETLDIPVFSIVLVGTVALFVLGLFGLATLVGRPSTPRRRRHRDEADAFAEIPSA